MCLRGRRGFPRGQLDVVIAIVFAHGVDDFESHLTISELNPKTYAHLDTDTKRTRSPIFSGDVQKNAEWHHIQCTRDPLIHGSDLYPNNLKNWDLDRVKAPPFDDLNQPSITNIEQVEIVEPRGLSRRPKTNSSGYLGIQRSLSRVGGERPEMHDFNFCTHGFFNEFQSSKIVEKIKLIERNFHET